MTAPVQNRPFMQDSIIWERKGPLPVWGWAALVLGIALVIAWVRRGKADKAASQAASGGFKDELPGDQTAPTIFLLPVNSPSQAPTPHSMPKRRPPHATVPEAPAGGGSPPPSTPPATAGTVIPEFLTAPAMTNLYSWGQEVEAQYPGISSMIDKAKATGGVKWGGPMGKDQYGNVPYFATPTQVRVR